jgi:hypothetical protein
MAIMALHAFFENLCILHELRECHEVSFSSASSCSSYSSLSHFIESDEGGEEGHVHKSAIICLNIVCDNAVIPTDALLRKQRRKRQLQRSTERQRSQQPRPIYNRSISVHSFGCSASSSRQQRLLKQSRAADHTLSLFSPEPASKRSSSPPPHSHEGELTTPQARHVHDLKDILIPRRRISPVSVMDASLLQSPSTNSPKDRSDDSLQHCDTPKINNTAFKSNYYYCSTFLEHGECVPSLLMEISSMSPIGMANNNNNKKKNRGNERVVTSKNISPRSARWSLLRQESDSALICPSRTRDLLFS